MTKIFIDTNIFLDMYRANLKNDIALIMDFLFKNKKYFITTEQSVNEFARNRYSILENALESFRKNTEVDNGSSSFLRSLSNYEDYKKSLEDYQSKRKEVMTEIQGKIDNPSEDIIYTKFRRLCRASCLIETTPEIIDSASRRKLCGNPPTSDKYTCGDEIIWESLLTYEKQKGDDLIVVSNDKTFAKNREFLSSEYAEQTGGALTICNNILDAYKLIDIELSDEIVYAAENLTWTDIIVTALTNLGGEATLTEIYNEANDILYHNDCYDKMKNKAKESTIRGILQRFSSDFSNSPFYGKKDLFHQVSTGVWALRQ